MGAPNQNIYTVNYQGVETNLTPPNHRTPIWLAWLKVLLYPLQWLHNNFFTDYANGSNYPFYSTTATYNYGDRVIDINNAVYECEADSIFNYSPHVNVGLAPGTYSFIPATGTDNLGNGASINMTNFNGPNGTAYHIYIELLGESFSWDDSQGNSGLFISLATGVPIQLSYGVTITWGGGIPKAGDNYYFTVSANVVWWLVSPDYRGVRPRTNFNGQKLVLEAILNQFFRTTFRQPATLQKPDIYIVNNQSYKNNVFVVGYTEAQSSVAVYSNSEAINFVEYSNSDYDFNDSCFTIYVPAALYFSISGGTGISGITITNGGNGYTGVPGITIAGGGGTGATATAILGPSTLFFRVSAVLITNAGTGYTSAPTITFSGGGGTEQATGYAVAVNTCQGDNTIRNCANRYVIAGMIYTIQPY